MIRSPLVSIIIPTYRRSEKLKNCLSSLIQSSYKKYEIIVIDDDPSTDLREFVNQYGAKYFHNDRESYPAKSRNIGARLSKGEILFFVDDDNFFDRDTILNLVNKFLEIRNVGLFGPLMLNSQKELWFCGARTNWMKPFLRVNSARFSYNEIIETDSIPNAYMIYRDLYFSVGGQDESLVFYNEEFDLAIRLKNAGYTNYIYTGSQIIHDYGTLFNHLTPFRLYINMRGMLIVERRYANHLKFIPFSIFFAGYILFYTIYRIPHSIRVSNRREYYLSVLRGIKDGIFSTSKLSPEYLIRDEK